MDGYTAIAGGGSGLPGGTSRLSASMLVGRSSEQALLREELAAAIAGHGRLVVVDGEAGIGKTTVTRDLMYAARSNGVRILSGHCYDRTNAPPYGPWLELFESYEIEPSLPAPPASLAKGRLTRVTNQAALFSDVRRFFAELAGNRPVLVVLEDLHWADPSSLDLLRYLGVYLGQWPILVVATYRPDELARHHSLYQHLPALVREADGLCLHLRRLDTDAFEVLVDRRYRLLHADAMRLVAYLTRHADGNPFFAVEILRALEEDGLLRPGDDRSSLGDLARVVVPPLLRQVIDSRLGRLGEGTRQPLEIAAVIGQEVSLALWATLADFDMDTLLSIVERAVGVHLMEAEREGIRVRFVHALTREALYEGILPPRRRLWHGRVGEALARETGADPEAVAFHFQQSGDPRAWEWLVQAGDRAQAAYAWLTAAERLRAAAALLEGVEGQERTYCRLVFRVAQLVRFSDPQAGIVALNEVERLGRRLGDTVLMAEAQWQRGHHLCYLDQLRSGLATILEGLETLEDMPPDTARITATIRLWFPDTISATATLDLTGDDLVVERLHDAGLDVRRCVYVWHLAAGGQPHEAAPVGERLVAMLTEAPAARGGIQIVVAFAAHGLGIAYAALGRPGRARHVWARSRELFQEVDHFVLIALSLIGELRDVALTYGAARPADRRRLAAAAETELARAGGALRPGVSPRLAWLGCLVLDGRWDEADEILRDLPVPGNAYLRREVTTTATTLARHRGDAPRAWDQILSLLPDGPETQPGDSIHQESLYLQRLAFELCLDDGDLVTARAWIEAHDRWLAWSGSVLGLADGQLAWARWHYANDDTARARSHAADALELASAPDQPLVRLAVHRLLGEMDTADGQYAPAEMHLAAALDLGERCETPFERTLTLLVLAHTYLERGANHLARPILDEVRGSCVRLGAEPARNRVEALLARLPAGRDPESHPLGLTRREVEVLRLLALHQTDKEIAEALFISRHTASTHVKHILTKLGVGTRREAAACAIDHGLI